MSYEGIEQYLCLNGHEFYTDCWADEAEIVCQHCGEKPIWGHSIDQTNGIIEGNQCTYEVALEVKEPDVVEVCSLGHSHIIKPATYKIPEKIGRRL